MNIATFTAFGKRNFNSNTQTFSLLLKTKKCATGQDLARDPVSFIRGICKPEYTKKQKKLALEGRAFYFVTEKNYSIVTVLTSERTGFVSSAAGAAA